MAKAYLALEDHSIYEGTAFGALHQTEGEVVFNTGMTGYQEVLTDPSYCGQIVTMTYPLIGNYGVNGTDPESAKPQVRGFIVRSYSQLPSNWKCEGSLDDYLKQNNIMALCGIDTRMLTKKLRNFGTMRGRLCLAPPTEQDFEEIAALKIQNPVQQVTCKQPYELPGPGKRVAVMDFGLKRSILTSLQNRGCYLRVFPAATKAEEVLAWNPDGIMLTNGPGDPKDNQEIITQVQKLLGQRADFRNLPGAPADGPGQRRGHGKIEIRTPRRQPPGEGFAKRAGMHYQPKSRLYRKPGLAEREYAKSAM